MGFPSLEKACAKQREGGGGANGPPVQCASLTMVSHVCSRRATVFLYSVLVGSKSKLELLGINDATIASGKTSMDG